MSPASTRSGWSSDVRVVSLGMFMVAFGTNVSTPLLILYKERLALSQSQTMGIFVAYVAGIIGVLLVAGPLSDRFGRRALVVPFVVVSAVASIILIFGRNEFLLLLLARCLLGMASGSVLGVGAAWMQELMGSGNEQRAAVLVTMATYLGFGLGPLTGAFVAEFSPWPLVLPFVIHAVMTAALIPWLLRASETVPRLDPPLPIRIEVGVPPAMRRTFRLVVFPAAIWVFAFASTPFALFPVLLSDAIDGSDVIVAGVAAVLTAGSALLAKPIMARAGARRTLLIGVAMGAIGYVFGAAAVFTDVWPLLFPAAILLGGSSGALTAGSLTVLGEIADAETRGAVTSTFYLLAYPGMAMPLIITSLASVTSLDLALSLMAAFGLVAMVVTPVLSAKEASLAQG